eukprot:scaffold960_cov239-Prasinococcus_capsulatus_cf.AAC.5
MAAGTAALASGRLAGNLWHVDEDGQADVLAELQAVLLGPGLHVQHRAARAVVVAAAVLTAAHGHHRAVALAHDGDRRRGEARCELPLRFVRSGGIAAGPRTRGSRRLLLIPALAARGRRARALRRLLAL